MTLEEAIEALVVMQSKSSELFNDRTRKACQLGIEALQYVNRGSFDDREHHHQILPGETKE